MLELFNKMVGYYGLDPRTYPVPHEELGGVFFRYQGVWRRVRWMPRLARGWQRLTLPKFATMMLSIGGGDGNSLRRMR